MGSGYEMLFETTIRGFLGDKASHIAGQALSEQSRKKWFEKALRKVIQHVQEIDTSTKHKEELYCWSERAFDALRSKPYDESVFVLCMLRLIRSLLGFVGVRPYRIATPAFFQTPPQHYAEVIFEGGDVMQDYFDEKSTLSVKKEIIEQLKVDGMSDFKISLVLNISEYQVKKLRKEF
jgi:hypothetical protein